MRTDEKRSSSKVYDILGIGFGPANLAIAVALAELNLERVQNSKGVMSSLFLESQDCFRWHPGMMVSDDGLTDKII